MLYHPDKNNDDPYSLTKFNEIKEAYETLINPVKKNLYLQERWLRKATGKKTGEEMITPPNILISSLELNQSVAAMDVHRMDHAYIAGKVSQLLNDEVIETLVAMNETEINRSIIHTVLNTITPLPLQESTLVTKRLLLLAQKDAASKEKIVQFIQLKQNQFKWNRYRAFGILLLTIALCLLIWFAGRG